MLYTITVRAFFVHTCSRFCRHFAFESRRISSCRRFLTDSKLISEDMQSILHLWQAVRYLSGHLRSLLLAVRNCSVPSQLRAKIHSKSALPIGFLLFLLHNDLAASHSLQSRLMFFPRNACRTCGIHKDRCLRKERFDQERV